MIQKLEKNFISVLIISALIAMAISFFIGSYQSVWFDEAYSISVAQQPLSQLMHFTAIDTHPPFYYLLLKLWAGIFGWSEIALRSLSVLSMGGALVFAGLLTKKMFNTRAALVTLPFIAFAPFLLRYGFEIRMYALASLICIAATYILIHAVSANETKKRQKLFLLYGFLVALGMYTLYYTAFVWLAHFVWLIWKNKKDKKIIYKTGWFKSYIFSVILFLPWLPSFIGQLTNGALAPIARPMTVDNLLSIVSFGFLYRPNWQLDGWTSLIIVFVITTICIAVVKAYKQVQDEKIKQNLVLLGLYFLVPIALLTLIGLFKPMYVERYLSHIIISAYILVGVCIYYAADSSGKKLKIAYKLLPVILIIGIVQLAMVGNYNFQKLQKPQIKQAAALIKCESNIAVLTASPYSAVEFGYYLPECQTFFMHDKPYISGGYSMLNPDNNLFEKSQSPVYSDYEFVYYVYYDEEKDNKDITISNYMTLINSHHYDSFYVDTYGAASF